jgi:TrmH family RNA methyltransferase
MLTKNQIKLIRSLSLKKNRQKHGLFVVEGEKLVNEILASDWEVESIYATKEWLGSDAVIVSKNELNRISSLKSPNKVLAVVKVKANLKPISGDTVLALDGIKDPGNLGTIIRLADWFGVKDIICSTDCVDYLNPKVVQSTMGSFARVNLHYTNLVDVFNDNPDYTLYVTVLNGTSLKDVKKVKKKIIILGSESKGVGEDILELKGERITIPKSKFSRAESLNVSIASAIILSSL